MLVLSCKPLAHKVLIIPLSLPRSWFLCFVTPTTPFASAFILKTLSNPDSPTHREDHLTWSPYVSVDNCSIRRLFDSVPGKLVWSSELLIPVRRGREGYVQCPLASQTSFYIGLCEFNATLDLAVRSWHEHTRMVKYFYLGRFWRDHRLIFFL